MKARIIGLLLVGALLAWPAEAALPPQYQRVNELKAILDNLAIVEAFGISHPIEKIERVGDDLYRVTSGSCSMKVAIEDDLSKHHAQGWAGPREFVVKPGKLTCK
jgi:hypothetical protein